MPLLLDGKHGFCMKRHIMYDKYKSALIYEGR